MEQLFTEQSQPGTEEMAQQFEIAKLDYARLATQEQSLIEKRQAIWKIFFSLIAIPTGCIGISLHIAVYLFMLVPIFVLCIASDIKHDEQVLRYDVRRGMKRLAKKYGYHNHDSDYSQQDGSRWWHGHYKIGRTVVFVGAEIICASIVSWYFYSSGQPVLSSALTILNIGFILATWWCMV